MIVETGESHHQLARFVCHNPVFIFQTKEHKDISLWVQIALPLGPGKYLEEEMGCELRQLFCTHSDLARLGLVPLIFGAANYTPAKVGSLTWGAAK